MLPFLPPQKRGRFAPLRYFSIKLRSIPPMQTGLSLAQLLYWAAMSSTTLTATYLASQGLTPRQVGDLSAFFALVGIFAPPFWGMISDRVRSVKWVFIGCLLVSAVAWTLSPFIFGKFGIGLVWLLWPIARFFFGPTSPLLDSWVARASSQDRRIGFGSVRMFGSIGYALMSVAYTPLIAYFGTIDVIFYCYGIMVLVTCACVFFLKDDQAAKRTVSFKDLKIGKLLSSFPYWTFLLFTVALSIPTNAGMSFLPYLLRSIGQEDLSVMGAILGLKALFEIPFFLFSNKLIRKFHPGYLLICAGSVYAIEMALYPFCTSVYQVFAVQCLHGAMYGLYLSSQIQYVHSLAPNELSATAQTISGAAMAFAGIVANTIGGRLFTYFGITPFYLSASAMQMTALLLFALSLKKSRRIQAEQAALGEGT